MAGMNRKEALDSCKTMRVEKVHAPGWATGRNKHVYVRVIPATENKKVRDTAAEKTAGSITEEQSMAAWCILGVTNARGVPLFKPSDRDTLAKGPFIPLQACFVAILKLNGITAAEDPEKN